MIQSRRQNHPKSRSGGGFRGSWSLSGRLGRLLGLPGGVLVHLGHVLGRLGGVLEGVLGAFWGALGVSWGFLERLGASWRRLGLDVRSKRDLWKHSILDDIFNR